MNWETPFGIKLQGNLVGTKAFPALRLHATDVLPSQSEDDDYNCGIGVVAAVGIILRDVIGVKLEDDLKFAANFSKKKLLVSFCKDTKEHICSFADATFQSLPPLDEMTGMGRQRKKTPGTHTGRSCVMETQNSFSVMKKITQRMEYQLILQVL